MAKAIIASGVCGFTTEVKAESSGQGIVTLEILTDCPAFQKLNDDLKEVDGMACVFGKIGEGPIYDACRVNCKHAACPVPMGITKAVEVAAGLALPRDVSVILTK